MKDRLASILSLLLVALASPVVIGAILVLYEASAPKERSLVVAVADRWGTGDAALADAAREAEALMQFRMTQADEENRRITAAYTRLYDAMGSAAQRASDLEAEVVRLQAKSIDETQWSRKLGTNIADIGCMLSAFSEEESLQSACVAGETLREGIVREYQDTLPGARPRLVAEVMADFPRPADLLSSEFARARDQFKGSEGAP